MASPSIVSQAKRVHYNDWPNSQGFDVSYEERDPVELEIEGSIPAFAAGILFRTGLGIRNIEAENGKLFRVHHWFDNLAQVHRFQIHPPSIPGEAVRVTYNSRSTCDGLIEKIRATGNRDGVTFGAKYDPCMSLFQKASSKFTRAIPPKAPLSKSPPATVKERPTKPDALSVAVTITSNYPGLSRNGEKLEKPSVKGKIQSLCNRTDTDAIQFLDPETLEPIGVASQTTLHPLLRGPSSATHSSTDLNGDVYNYNLEFINGQGVYRVFRVSASTGHTSILATITDNPAYIHSTLLTEHYMILCVWNAHYAFGGASILWTKNIVDALADYDPDRPCRWYVIDKRTMEAGGGLVATFESDPFFCFHTINAYEEVYEDGKVDIIADLVAYENLDVLKRLYIENLISDSSKAVDFSTLPTCRPQIRRFTLANVEGHVTENFGVFPGNESAELEAISTPLSLKNLTPELPTISPNMLLKKHRFVYGVLHTGKSTMFDSIVKYDVSSQTAKTWSKHGHTPGEPILVADPTGTGEADEDLGVLLSVVLDGIGGKSYLLVLDARTMEEMGKAKVPGVIGFGFHGTHVPC